MPATHTSHDDRPLAGPSRAALDGVLRTLILPLDVDVAGLPTQPVDVEAGTHIELFAPGQRDALERFLDPDAPKAAWTERATPGDIGLGLPEVLATRVYRFDAPSVRFGASETTLDQSPGDVERRTWVVAPAVCITLWSTSALPVLTIERLELRPSDGSLLGMCRDAGYARDVVAAVEGLLAGTPLDQAFSLADVFRAPRTSWLRRRHRESWTVPVASLRVAATEHVRGVPVTECLFAVTAPAATDLVDTLLVPIVDDSFVEDERAQASGTTHRWAALTIVEKPAEARAVSAIRDDSRHLFLNLEAMSVNHDYRGAATGGILPAAIPVVALRAATAKDYRRLVDEFGPTSRDRKVDDRIAAVEQVKMGVLHRQMVQRLIAVEAFRKWTTPGALASELYNRIGAPMAELANHSAQAAEIVQNMLDRVREQRQQRNERLVQALSPAAGVVALGSLFAALASVPDPSEPSLLVALPDALAVTLALVAVTAAIGIAYFIRRR